MKWYYCREHRTFNQYDLGEHCPHCEQETSKVSKFNKGITFSVLPDLVTNNITGETIRIKSRKEEEQLCNEFRVAPYDDFRETFKKGEEEREKSLNEIDDTDISIDFDKPDFKKLRAINE